MEAGDVVRAALPQVDALRKPRPAVLVAKFPPFDDWLVIGISSNLHLTVPGLDVLIDQGRADFASTGLNHTGVVRLGFAHIIPKTAIEGRIGHLDEELLALIKKRFTDHVLASR